MKTIKIMMMALMMCFVNVSFGQTVNGIPLKDIDVEYVQIVGTAKAFSTKLTIDIDFGQKNKIWSSDDTKLLDESGTPVVLNSMIDALNFMSNNNYQFITAYTLTIGSSNVYHFILKKKN